MIIAWSISAAAHALVGSFAGFITARSALGLGEAGNFPSAIKAVALWFPKRERAFATSIFNAGTNAGALVAPAIIPWMAYTFGWQSCFIAAGIAGLLWLFLWVPFYDVPDKCKRVGAAELALIRSDREDEQPQEKVPWLSLLGYRQTWSFFIAKFLTDPVWWFFLIWLPDFFKKTRGLDIKKSWIHIVTIYGIVTVLSIFGGWVTGYLTKRGWTVTRARKTGMFIFALCALPILMVTRGWRLDGGAADRPGRVGAPGLVGESLHHRVRHVPQEGRGLGDRHWRHGGLGGRHPLPGADGQAAGPFPEAGKRHRRLCHSVWHLRLHVPGGLCAEPPLRAALRAVPV